ncbi:MAG: ParA family protein [Oscillospiraceae bacterium]|nr:ParA family protein [Oscillospiraceae bacterium]
MAKVLTFFNHKGGVGKTTLAYNVAWGLAAAGKRVLMIDADAQCNLTEITVEDKHLYAEEQLSLFPNEYSSDFFLQNNVYEYFSYYVTPAPGKSPPEVRFFEKKDNLKLLTGSIRFAELDETISLALAGINALEHVPGSVYAALNKLGEDFDWVVVDLSPALSHTNQLFLMLTDYFIVPVNPSIFSKQALQNLDDIFRSWNRRLSGFDIFSRKTKALPLLLGIVCQNYRPYSRKDEKNTKSAKRFEERLETLNECAVDLANDLNSFKMALKPGEFSGLFPHSTPYRIANIPDYNQLAVVSETEKIPVTGLTEDHLKKPIHKLNTPEYLQKITDFQGECANIVNGLLKL